MPLLLNIRESYRYYCYVDIAVASLGVSAQAEDRLNGRGQHVNEEL